MTKDIPTSPTKSSMIDEIGYDTETKMLRVKFKNGKTYDHPDVSMEKYAAFTGANSVGGFYNTKIRDAHPGQMLKKPK